MLRIAVSIQ